MWQETGSLMRRAGYHVRRLDTPHQVNAAFLVVVELERRCGTEPPAIPAATKSLASTVIEDGRILPLIHVSCTALRQFLASALASKSDPEFLYGRALGRLLAHELYHVAARTTGHTRIGLTQASVSVSELLSGQFAFCQAAVERLRPSPPQGNEGSRSEP